MIFRLWNGEEVTLEEYIAKDNVCRYQDEFRISRYDNTLWISPIMDSDESVDVIFGKEHEHWWFKSQQEYRDFIIKNKTKRIFVSKMKSLDFLSGLDSIEIVEAYDCYDYSALYSLKNLKKLSFFHGKMIDVNRVIPIDVSKFKSLESFSSEEGKKYVNLEKATWLKELNFTIKKSKDIQFLTSLTQLQRLSLDEGKIKSLAGIENFKELQWLDLSCLRCLEDISQIKHITKNFRVLDIYCCPKVKNLEFLSECANMRSLTLNMNIKLPNVNFINNMPHICKASFDDKILIEDGNTEPLRNIEFHYFKNRKTYNYNIDFKNRKPANRDVRKYLTDESVPIWRAKELYDNRLFEDIIEVDETKKSVEPSETKISGEKMTFRSKLFGEINYEKDVKLWCDECDFGLPFMVSADEEWTKDTEKMQALADFLDININIESKLKEHLKKIINDDTELSQSLRDLYFDFHIEELDKDTLREIFDCKSIKRVSYSTMIDKLKLVAIRGLDASQTTFCIDMSYGYEYTDLVICVTLDKQANILDIQQES